VGDCVGGANFLGQSIDIEETNTFQLKFFFQLEKCKRCSFGRFVRVRVEVACSRNIFALLTKIRNLYLNPLALIISEITAFTRTDGHD